MSKDDAQDAARVQIFEPPMCCPTGMCGPTQDQTLLDLMETVRLLETEGVPVARHQPGGNAAAFMSNAEVMAALKKGSTAALPITVVDGHVVKSGAYATLAEIREALNGGAR